MKLNGIERLVVNNPLRRAGQHLEMQWFSRKLPTAEGSKILEIGCGRGAGAKLVKRKFRPNLFCLLDLDVHMIRKAQLFLNNDLGNLYFCTANATSLPFESGSFDAVFGFGFLHHVTAWQHSVSEIARVLRTGGIYYIEELYPELYQNFITKRILIHPTTNRFQSPDLKNALKKENLDLVYQFEIKKLGILGIGVKK